MRGHDGPVNDFVVVSWTPSTSVSWGSSTRTTRCTAPCFPRKATGGRAPSIDNDSGHSALERLLEMVSSACGRKHGFDRCLDAADRWLPERLRLRPQSEPTCPLGTRRDTSRRCGGLATVPSASVVLHADAREQSDHLTTTGDVRSSLIHAVNRRVAPTELSGEAHVCLAQMRPDGLPGSSAGQETARTSWGPAVDARTTCHPTPATARALWPCRSGAGPLPRRTGFRCADLFASVPNRLWD